MKLKGRRQSKNVEVQTPKEQRAARGGLIQQEKALGSDVLREPTPVKDQGFSESTSILRQISNPAAINSRMASNPEMAGRAIKSPGERRGVKDPKPKTFSQQKDFPFFKHSVKGK